jgi:hypothetical protein
MSVVLLLLAALAGGLVSCGEDERAAYREAFVPLNQDVQSTGRRVDEAMRDARSLKNDAAVAAAFATLAADASHLAGSVASLTPPDGLTDEQRMLIGGLRAAAGGLARVSRAAVDGDRRSARDARRDIARAAQDIREPRRRIVAALDLE